LFWSIYDILKKKGDDAPQFVLLENVDRLIKSPASKRGRDFAVILSALSDLGYMVEWKVVNASDYGFPQRRKRIYILCYHINKTQSTIINQNNWLINKSIMADAFPSKIKGKLNEFDIKGNLSDIFNNFSSQKPHNSPFYNCGFMSNRKVFTADYDPIYNGDRIYLGDLIEKKANKEFYVKDKDLEKWKYFKGAKKLEKHTTTGFRYIYSEGAMKFPDALDLPSRTIITGEGGSAPSRFKHIIKTSDGLYRRLTPLELERLNMFPDNHTKVGDISDTKRAFLMGNALVVGCITRIGISIAKFIKNY
jgi:DNA (cytosine-5)-methyltransferase 1